MWLPIMIFALQKAPSSLKPELTAIAKAVNPVADVKAEKLLSNIQARSFRWWATAK